MFAVNKNIVTSCGLDRYLNVFDCKHNLLDKHLYMKTKLNCILPIEFPEVEKSEDDEMDEEDEEDYEEGGEESDDTDGEDNEN